MRTRLSPAVQTTRFTRAGGLSALALVLCGLAFPAWAGTPTTPIGRNPRVSPTVEVARKNRMSVVNIHSERMVPGVSSDPFHPTSSRVNGMGTGIVIDPRGYIVTNQHVVEDVQVIRIRLADGSSHNARVLARDNEHDLAILKIDGGRHLTTIALGTASDLMVGEPVIAIGNAFGYEHTHTTGIVSSVKRDVALNKEMSYKNLIQTDASINPGNSGGPLLNIHGELIGVNVAIRAGAQNIGFAIPVDSMILVAADLISLRRRTGVHHGIFVRDAVDTSANPVTRTCIIDRIEGGSAAEKAGLKAGDRITKIGDIDTLCSLDIERAFMEKTAGEKMAIVVIRDGLEKTLEIAVPAAAQVVVSSSAPAATNDILWRRLGVRIVAVDAAAVAKANPQLRGGVLIQDVQAEGMASRAGIQRGDILVGLDQYETLNTDNVTWVLSQVDAGALGVLKFFVVRGNQIRRGTLQ